MVYLDYGFARERMAHRQRLSGEPFTFGYIGTHIPAKGIHNLIRAFGQLQGDARLRIWGRPRGQDTAALKQIADAEVGDRIKWVDEYKNQEIVRDVFDRCDAIVVPSIWVENSPLVIHEAQQARVPVITADVGGMAEYVQHEINGLLYRHRSIASLAMQMQRFIDAPELAARLGARGYLYTESGDIPAIADHVREVEQLYDRVLKKRAAAPAHRQSGPWRITFDTNPDTCNLRCVMCEEHSPHSPLRQLREETARSHRLMPFALIARVVAEAAACGLKEIIPSTMGEPLLYGHFEDILNLCRQYQVKLNLTTNGTFPKYGASAWAERIVPVASDVKISWNGATKSTHEAIMLRSNWETALQNVQDFITVRDAHAADGGNRCRVTLQLTYLETNVTELADIVRLAVRLGVDRVKGHHLWAHFDQIKNQSMRRNPEAIARWNSAVQEAYQVAAEERLPNGERILLENLYTLDASATDDLAPGGRCPFLGKEAWISAGGRFDPCCAPDAQRRTLGEFGNLHEMKFMDIWNGAAYRELMRSYQSRALCQGCNMRKPNEAVA